MANSYVSLPTVRGTGALDLGTGTALDRRLLLLIEDVSRGVDRFSNRQFFILEEQRQYDGDGKDELLVSDLIAVGTLEEDSNADGTFNTVWNAADYRLWPYNAAPTSSWGRPYSKLVVNTASDGTQDIFQKGQRNYRVTGTWGYTNVTVDSGRNGSDTLDSTSTELVLTGGTNGTFIEVGHTLFLNDEQMYVTSASSGATAVTVERGVNGSTATAHPTSDVNVVQYPGPITEAVIMQTSRLCKRKDSAFATEIGFPESGQMMVFRGLDPDVKQFLLPYRRLPVG